jgi:hypothetical protein
MPGPPQSPNVFVEEPSFRPGEIEQVPTSVTCFVGSSLQGPIDAATEIDSVQAFEGVFGPVTSGSHLGYSVRDFFVNGGRRAIVVRVGSGLAITGQDILGGPDGPAARRGIYALDGVDLINLLVIPPYSGPGDMSTWDVEVAVLEAAIAYARERWAMVVAGPPAGWVTVGDAWQGAGMNGTYPQDENLAVYFPRLRERDATGQLFTVDPAGAVAGVIARTDIERGVWVASAGRSATLRGAQSLTIPVSSSDVALLNPLGVNALRLLPGSGPVVWGARTRISQTVALQEWTYVPVRRLGLLIEASLARGLSRAVFEPNTPQLWATIRNQVQDFLTTLWRTGALLGTTPSEAFFVQVGPETMTADDIAQGRLNVVVGFAPHMPAEFVVVRAMQQTATP